MQISVLDVRSMLKAKQKPYDLIMSRVESLGKHDVFELHTPFKPTPLYKVLGKRGLQSVYCKKSLTHYVSQFTYAELGEDTFHVDLRSDDAAWSNGLDAAIGETLNSDLLNGGAQQVAVWTFADSELPALRKPKAEGVPEGGFPAPEVSYPAAAIKDFTCVQVTSFEDAQLLYFRAR